MSKENKGDKLLSELIKKRAKKAVKVSAIGWLGGIKGRLAVFSVAFIVPFLISMIMFAGLIVILSGGMVAVMEIDPSLKVEDKPPKESGGTGGSVREINIPENLKGKLLYPTGTRFTSKQGMRYGRMHQGIDLAGNYGGGKNNVYPIYPGEVVSVNRNASTFGYLLVIKHDVEGTTLHSLYAHMLEMYPKEGDLVDFNTVLGIQGERGNSQGVHLHLELHDANYKWHTSSTALQVFDYLHCGDATLSNSTPIDITKCMDYRFETTGSGK